VRCDRFIGRFKDLFFKRICYIALDGRTLVSYELDGAIRRCFLAVGGWVQSQVASCDAVGGRSENVTWFPQSFFTLQLLIFVYMLNNHCHRVTAQLQFNKYYYYSSPAERDCTLAPHLR
jgi:hypothetical protein